MSYLYHKPGVGYLPTKFIVKGKLKKSHFYTAGVFRYCSKKACEPRQLLDTTSEWEQPVSNPVLHGRLGKEEKKKKPHA